MENQIGEIYSRKLESDRDVMFIALAVHHPKGVTERIMMDLMPRLAEVSSRHKGFIQTVVAEVEGERILIPFTIWETAEDYMAARADIAAFLSTIDFSVQVGPTRAGGAAILNDSKITIFKVAPVTLRPSQ
jgi:hypothetical protein